MSTPSLPLYQPPEDLARYDVLYTFGDLSYYGRAYVTFISELPGADLLATLLGEVPDDEEEDDDVMTIEDYLLSASEDPRNAGWLSPLRDSEGDIIGVAVHLRTEQGQTRVLVEDVGANVIGIQIASCVPLSEEEIAQFEAEQEQD